MFSRIRKWILLFRQKSFEYLWSNENSRYINEYNKIKFMHALVYTGTEKIVYREEKDPTTKPGETLVKVHASGICGSDMHAYHGKDERRVPPLILGHEFSGISLDGKFKNKNVIINPLISCEKCDYCKNKREHLFIALIEQ